MKIYAKCPPTKCAYLTSGREYEVLRDTGKSFSIMDDEYERIDEAWIDGTHTGGDWERIIREEAGDGTLTVRDRFAMAALPSVIIECVSDECSIGETMEAMFSRKSYRIADAMMEARKK